MTRDKQNTRSDLMRDVLKRHLIDGQSVRLIARETGLARQTVRRMLGLETKKVRVRERKISSLLDPYRAEIATLLDATPTIKAPAVLERLRACGYGGGVTIVRDLLRAIRPKPHAKAFLTLDFLPGARVQVDWADFGFCIPGCARRVSGFMMALCYSRLLYVEFVLSQTMGSFLRCMERGLAFFGGRTEARANRMDSSGSIRRMYCSLRPRLCH
ncbi:MAG: transposase [Deltaproteobacteria bacterium]|nr:transposase [Deltaproteobacteria bacterium]